MGRRTSSSKRDEVFRFRLTRGEANALTELAKKKGLTRSELLREALRIDAMVEGVSLTPPAERRPEE